MDDFIRLESVSKSFGGVRALDRVSLSIRRGECHGLMGENGAGKSTLGKILAGIHAADEGTLTISGEAHVFRSPRAAIKAGVAMVHQELAFCPDLSVAENLALGRYPRKWFGVFDRVEAKRRAENLLADIGVHLDVSRNMRELSTAQEQLVQIAAAVGTDPRIIVFDEPTSSLSESDAQNLFALIESLKGRGITTIYVSHRMPELFRLCDRLSVLRDGRYVGTLDHTNLTQDAVVQMMIGRKVEDYFPPPRSHRPAETPAMHVMGLSSPGKFQEVEFEIAPGEIVGFAGLMGAGRSEVATALFGLDPRVTGQVRIDGELLTLRSVRESMRRGIGLVPEDRKRQGCVLGMACRANVSLAMLERLNRGGFLDRAAEQQVATEFFDRLRVKAASIDAPVLSLSGGNQQKIVLAKWLARGGRLLIVDEPTRGVDVGAKAAIHALLGELAEQGLAIMLISSELPEVLSLSSRVLVMRGGRLVGEVSGSKATQESVLRLMAGVETLAA